VAPGHALDEASDDVRTLVADLRMPPGYSVRMQSQTRNLDETTTNLVIALASVFVYMVLAARPASGRRSRSRSSAGNRCVCS
jgi:multidrug efflux pump subunit AcrB